MRRSQKLPISLVEAWDFFSSPKNLKRITPEYMGFDIVGECPEKMYPGLFIHYKVKPLLGIPHELDYGNYPGSGTCLFRG